MVQRKEYDAGGLTPVKEADAAMCRLGPPNCLNIIPPIALNSHWKSSFAQLYKAHTSPPQ